MMDSQKIYKSIDDLWQNSVLPTLCEFIRIPNKSPAFDPAWETNGHMDKAVQLIAKWCQEQNISGMKLDIHRAPGKTPLLLIEVPGELPETLLLYGHLDKQPEMSGWHKDLNPWTPVIKNDRLYGRGSADDGYAVFSAITAIKTLQEFHIPHARCVILIECSEESGSTDLPYYMQQLQSFIGTPDLVIGLDSGCGNYQQWWCTTSLRGLISGVLKIEILKEGVHSGSASGIVPSSFRILRQLLSRVENEMTGEILLDALQAETPSARITEAKQVATILGNAVWQDFPFANAAKPSIQENDQLVLNRTWKSALSITGIEGLPVLSNAGNVLRPYTAVMLSLRVPPTCNAQIASQQMKEILEANPPYQSNVTFEIKDTADGWNAPPTAEWLKKAVNNSSQDFFGKPALYWGEGGTIPFMGMLGKQFPKAQFIITGVLGPQSNAHGPNEFLDIPTAKKITCCIAQVIAEHYQYRK